MTRTLTICGSLICAFQLAATDLSGTWAGSFDISTPDGQTRPDRCHLELEQSGSTITGSVGPDKSVRWTIENGKVDGNRIRFDVLPPEGGRLAFDLRLAGGHLRGEARGENQGLAFTAKVDLTRMTE